MTQSLKQLIVEYQANAQPVIIALNHIENKIKSTSASIQSIGSSFRSLGVELAATFSIPLGILAKKAISASADFESLRMKMDVLAGSTEKGAELFERLVNLDVYTPFELSELTQATNIMMGFGQSSDDAYQNLLLLGDIAAVVGADFNRLAITFGQASAEGKLYTKDIREFINNSIPIVGMLADELGVAQGKIFDLAEEGKITFPILIRTLQRATTSGGMFEGGMKKLARTSKGVWSTFKGVVNIALAEFGNELQKTFGLTEKLEKFGNWISKMTENFKKLYPETKRNIFLFLGALTIIPPLLIILGTFIKIIGILKAGLIAIIAPLRWIISGLSLFLSVLRGVMLVFATNPLTAFIAATIAIIYYWREIVDLFKKAVDFFSKISISDIFEKAKNFIFGLNSNLGTTSGENSIENSLINNRQANNNSRINNNNLIVNIPSTVSSSDANNIKEAIKKALQEQNRQSYMELGTL